jgi:hypothetical protein
MKFIEVRDALITLLGDASNDEYRVLGYQEQGRAAQEIKDNNRLVQIFYSSGRFPGSKSGLSGPYQHDPTYKVQLSASKETSVDLSALQNPSATPEEIEAAWDALKPAEQAADEALDELWSLVFNVLMDPRNRDFGLDYKIGSRWLDDFNKDSIIPRGRLAILTGSANLTCTIEEEIIGEIGIPGQDICVTVDIDGDLIERTGVEVQTLYMVDDITGDYLIDDTSGDYIVEG